MLTNDYDSPRSNGSPTITYALTVSCNTAFAKLGDTFGGSALHNYANLFGFNNPALTIPLAVSPSSYPLLTDPAQTALSAIGQFNDTVTPLQEAMIAAAIANGGTLMRPYLVQQVKAPRWFYRLRRPSGRAPARHHCARSELPDTDDGEHHS